MKTNTDKIKLISAFAIVYFVWGSTYLAIKIVVNTLPPLSSAGVRFLLAGMILYSFKRLRGIPKPEKHHWKSSAIAGAIFFLISNGGIMIAIQYVDSGITALLVALTPCWIVIIDRISGKTRETGILTIIGLSLGLFGLLILFNPFKAVSASGELNLLAAAAIVLCSISWAFGSIFVREAKLPESRSLSAAMQMICGGVLLIIAGAIRGEWLSMDIQRVSSESIFAFIYLVFIGSIVAFTAFNWLLKTTTSAKAGTYAFVNPVVAMILGFLLGGEVLSIEGIISALIIILGVVLISLESNRKKPDLVKQAVS